VVSSQSGCLTPGKMAIGTPLIQGWVCPQRECRRLAEDKNILPLPAIESRNLTVEDKARGSNVSMGTQDHESATLFTAVPWNLRGSDSDLWYIRAVGNVYGLSQMRG